MAPYRNQLWISIRFPTLAFGWILPWTAIAIDAHAQLQNPQDSVQELFDRLSNQPNTFLPGFLGDLTEEQLKKIREVEIPPSEEKAFGEKVLAGFLDRCKETKVKVLQTGKEIVYLKSLCSAVQPLMKQAKRYPAIDLLLVESDATDAYSIPGGHVVVTRGLLDTVGTESALVGVLAHEIAHLDHGHQLLPLKQMRMMNQSIDFRNRMDWMSLVFKPFRPEFETQADIDAVRWMMELLYEPKELARLLHSWDQRQDKQAPWMNFVPGFVKSHPDAGKRAQRVLEQAAALQGTWPKATYTGAKNLELRVPASKRRFP